MAPVLLNPSRFAVAPAAGYVGEVLADNPLVFLKLNETTGGVAADSSGGARYAFINGTPSGYAVGGPAGIGPALSLDTDSYVSITAASWMLTGSAGSLEFWFRTGSTGDMSIGGLSAGGGNFFFIDHLSDDTLRFYVTTSGLTVCSATVGGLRDDTWHHIVATYDGTNMKLYADKVLKQTTAKTGSISTSIGDLRIGRRFDDGSTLPQRAAAFAMYDTALSATRIAAHYDAGVTP